MNFDEALDTLVMDIVHEAQMFGKDLSDRTEALRAYAAERAEILSDLVGDPNFDYALRAERDNVALAAGIAAVQAGDAADQRLIGMIQVGMRFLAGLLV